MENLFKHNKWGAVGCCIKEEGEFCLSWSQSNKFIKICLRMNKVIIYGKWKKYWSNVETNFSDSKILFPLEKNGELISKGSPNKDDGGGGGGGGWD